MSWKSFLPFFIFSLPVRAERQLALTSHEFVGEQSRKERNMKHVPSCTSLNEGVGCVCNITSCSRVTPSPDKLPL